MAAERNYKGVARELEQSLRGDTSRTQRMQAVARALWRSFGDVRMPKEVAPQPETPAGLSWVGFYEIEIGADGGPTEQMLLLEREPKPACSPIGLHGMCGRGWRERVSLVIPDVRTLGEDYVACDPADMSELVVPMFASDGSCWGVLDADSYGLDAFSQHDAAGFFGVARAAGLTAGDEPGVVTV
ncbi:MAG: hypothetical protein AAF747_08400 [Planctomycetota bacterium]